MGYHVCEPAEGMSDAWIYDDEHQAQGWAHELELQQEEREMAFKHE